MANPVFATLSGALRRAVAAPNSPAVEMTGCDAESASAASLDRAGTSQAMRNLRGVAIPLVVAMHSVMPYLAFVKPPNSDFSQPPYSWLAFPIVDGQRWLGFDLLDGWLDVYLMSLMFFLSGLFTWPSLASKGSWPFFAARLTRLGAPFVFGLLVLMPIAIYPAYRLTALEPSLAHYLQAYLALPFWPTGPMWFLSMLLAFTTIPAVLHRYLPGLPGFLARLSAGAARSPGVYFLGLATAATLAYVPLALAFSPWDWTSRGLITFQLSRPLLYAVYYFAGCGIGAHGLADGLLACGGKLAKGWRIWLIAAFASLAIWMGLTGLTLSYANAAPSWLQMLSDASYAWAGASSVLFMLAVSLRLSALRSGWLDAVSQNAFGIYILHYVPLVWLQYALMDFQLPAIAKAPLVLAGTLCIAFLGTSAFKWVLRGAGFPGVEPARV